MKDLKEFKTKIEKFEKAAYPSTEEHLDFKKCLETLTGNPNAEILFEDGHAYISIGDRRFEIVDLYCPDYNEPNANIFDTAALISLSRKTYLFDAYFDSSEKLEQVQIFCEDEKGCFEKNGKKYSFKDVISQEKLEKGFSLER